jgi:hypothetical protein
MNGCIPVPLPDDIGTRHTYTTLDLSAIESNVKDQSVTDKLRRIEGRVIDAYLRDNVCPCSRARVVKMKVSEVDNKKLHGYKRPGTGWTPDYESDPSVSCESFISAKTARSEAERLSKRGSLYFLPSLQLIFESERALSPLECDPIRAKTLADKAIQLAEEWKLRSKTNQEFQVENTVNTLLDLNKQKSKWLSQHSLIEVDLNYLNKILIWKKSLYIEGGRICFVTPWDIECY